MAAAGLMSDEEAFGVVQEETGRPQFVSGRQLLSDDEAFGTSPASGDLRDPRDIAATRGRPYSPAIQQQNVQQPLIPGSAGISGGSLSDGMAEYVSFASRLEEEQQTPKPPPGAGVMWGYDGQIPSVVRLPPAGPGGIRPTGEIGPITGPKPTLGTMARHLGRVVEDVPKDMVYGTAAQIAGLLSKAGVDGMAGAEKRALEKQARLELERLSMRPEFEEDGLAALAYGGLENIAYMAPVIAGSLLLAPGKTIPALAGIFEQQAARSYGEYRRKGIGVERALPLAQLQGLIEAGTEALPMATVVKILGKGGLKTLLSQRLREWAGREVPSELLASLSETAVDRYLAVGQDEKTPTLAEYLEEVKGQIPQILVTTGMMAGGLGIAGKAARRAEQRAAGIKPREEKATPETLQAIEQMKQASAAQPPPSKSFEAVKDKFVAEKDESGNVVYRAPNGARITPDQWENASDRLKTAWLTPVEGAAEQPVQQEQPQEQPQKRESRRVAVLREALDRETNPKARVELQRKLQEAVRDEQIQAAALDKAQRLTELAASVEDEGIRREFLDEAKDQLRRAGILAEKETPPATGIAVKELTHEESVASDLESLKEQRPSTKGISVAESTLDEAVGQEKPEAKPSAKGISVETIPFEQALPKDVTEKAAPTAGINVTEMTPEEARSSGLIEQAEAITPEEYLTEKANREAQIAAQEAAAAEQPVPPAGEKSADRALGLIAEARQRIQTLQADAEQNPEIAAEAKKEIAFEQNKIRRLIDARNALAKAAKVKDKALQAKVVEKANKVIESYAPKEEPAKVEKASKDQPEPKYKDSRLLTLLVKVGGISRSIMHDLGLDDVYKITTRIDKRGVRVPQKRKLTQLIINGKPLFPKEGGLQEDGVLYYLKEAGFLQSDDVGIDQAGKLIERELESPGSVRPIGEAELFEKAKAQKTQDEEHREELIDDLRSIGVHVDQNASLKDVREAHARAFANEWISEMDDQEREAYDFWKKKLGLVDEDAINAALTRQAAEIDPDAIEEAALRHADDDDAFMRVVREVLREGSANGREGRARRPQVTEPAVQGGAGNATVGLPEMDIYAGGPESRAQDQAGGQEGTARGQPEPRAVGEGAAVSEAQPGAERSGGDTAGRDQKRDNVREYREVLDNASKSLSDYFKRNVKFVLDVPRTPEHRFWLEFMKNIGGEAAFFRDEGDHVANGFYNRKSNVIFINVNADKPGFVIAGHEFGHWLKQNHEDLWKQFLRDILPNIKNLHEYHKELADKYTRMGGEPLSGSRVIEEFVSDVFADALNSRDFLLEVAKQDETFFRKLAKAIVDWIAQFVRRVKAGSATHSLVADRFIEDMQAVRSRAIEIMSMLQRTAKETRELEAQVQSGLERIALESKKEDLDFALSIAGQNLPSPLGTNQPGQQLAMLPEERAWVRRWFDVFDRALDVERAASEVGRPLSDKESIRLAEKLFHGKVEHVGKQFDEKYVRPLVEELRKIRKLDLTVKDAGDYLMAKHAPERNATMALRDPQGRHGLSGITDQQAKQIIGSFTPEQTAALERVADLVYKINEFKLDTLVNSGLIKQESADFLRQQWKYYVPLKDISVEDEITGIGRGFQIWANDIKKAFGRTTAAGNPIANAIHDATRAILRAGKAEVEQTIWRAAQVPELHDIIRPYDPDNPPDEVKTRKDDQETGTWKMVVDPAKVDALTMNMVINGENVRVFVPDETLLTALKKAGNIEKLDAVLRGTAVVTRTLGRTLTEWNPTWSLPNAVKDAIVATLRSRAIKGMSATRVLARIPKAWAQIITYHINENSPLAAPYREFLEQGGKTGAYGLTGPAEILAGLARSGARVSEEQGVLTDVARYALAGPKAILDTMSFLNEVVEYATRLASYTEARRAGYSKERAAEIAKEITVNFNRKGEMSKPFGALYVFFNAAMQGTYGTFNLLSGDQRLIKAGSTSPARMVAALSILPALGMATEFVNWLVGGDDEESGLKNPQTISEYTLDHNVTLFNGREKGGHFKLPLPPEYTFLYAMGRRSANAVLTGKYMHNAAGIVGGIIDSLVPVRLSEADSVPEQLAKAAIPFPAAPIYDVIINKNFLGGTIVPPQRTPNAPVPYASIARRSTSDVAKLVSKGLNVATGGDEVTPGYAQKILGPFASAEAIEYLTRAYTGGLGQFVLQTSNLVKALNGDESAFDRNKAPVVSRFYSERPKGYMARAFDKVEGAIQREMRRQKAGLAEEDDAARDVIFTYRSVNSELKKLFDEQKKAAIEGDLKRSEELQENIRAVQARLVRAYLDARRSKGLKPVLP
jgi:hypothetical protein